MRLWNVAAVPEVRGKPVLISVPGIPLEKEEDVVGFSWKKDVKGHRRVKDVDGDKMQAYSPSNP